MIKTQVPVVEGLFTMDSKNPHLIGGKGKSSYFFPKDLAGRDPGDGSGEVEAQEVLLSNEGTVWSYTSSDYAPPLPYIAKEPWEPFVLAAVKLEAEKLVVLGQMVEDTELADMHIGMQVKLVLEVLYEDEEKQYLVWKWKEM